MLHSGIPPRAAVYIKDATGNLHEIVFVPERRPLDIDVVSTIGENSTHWHEQLLATLKEPVAGFLSFILLGTLAPSPGSNLVTLLRSATVTAVGGFFLYDGLKAVHVTEMANRVWKRSAEYSLILGERRRLKQM